MHLLLCTFVVKNDFETYKKIGYEISLAKVFNTRGSLRGEKVSQLKVALSQKILENFYISNINMYSKFLSCAENLNFPPKTVNNSFKLSTQDSNLEYLCWRRKNFPVSSDLKPPLGLIPSNLLLLSYFHRKNYTKSGLTSEGIFTWTSLKTMCQITIPTFSC